MRPVVGHLLVVLLVLAAACTSGGAESRSGSVPDAVSGTRPAPTATTAPAPAASAPAPSLTADERRADPGGAWSLRPAWLGTRPLPLRPDGFGEVRPTPEEMRDRRLASPDPLPPPVDAAFAATIEPVPQDVAGRSTWSRECPVRLAELRYVTLTFWGFDERAHTGELLVHVDVAEKVTDVFAQLFRARFPIEEMRVVSPGELDAPPTGDGNNTTAFVCRPTRGSSSWSQHAYGLAIDVNPFHNPYVKDDLVLPELASAYVDRDWRRPGMIHAGDVVVEAFAAVGWDWGGDWSRPKDWMHFSRSGR